LRHALADKTRSRTRGQATNFRAGAIAQKLDEV
jgi:hypothetical protein